MSCEPDALAASEERYRRLFDEDVTGRLIARPDWTLVRCNRALAHMLGCDHPASLEGRRLVEFASEPIALQKLLAIARAAGAAGPVDLQLERIDGEQVYGSLSVAGELDAAGDLTLVRGQLVEVTESRRLQTRLLGAQ